LDLRSVDDSRLSRAAWEGEYPERPGVNRELVKALIVQAIAD
jgi:hypothetical protein